MMLMKKTFLLSLLLWGALTAGAQKSYVYIELIKTIPCKITQNGREVQLLSKNFAVIPISEDREQNIDIEFGGDLFPRQSFVIDAVADALYAYKLAKSGESSFYLLDLVNNGKIIESNSAINIGLATDFNTINYGINQKVRYNTNTQKKVYTGWLRKRSKSDGQATLATKAKPVVQQKKIVPNKEPKPSKQKTAPDKKVEIEKPQYGVVEVINARDKKVENSNQDAQLATKAKKIAPTVSTAPSAKSSCYLTASDKEIDSFIEKTRAKSDDEAKLLLLRKKQFTGCLTVNQVIRIANDFSTHYGKYNVVRISFSNIGNPEDIMQCESLFKTEGYRNKFYRLVDPQE